MAGTAQVRTAILVLLTAALALAACGKKGPPSPPGPPDQIIYPKVYPSE
jgi:predicted small lipoprotein YifL